MSKSIKNNLYIFFVLLISIFTLPLFFYKLSQTSLISWDEAWYAEVARNILRTGNIIDLSWNNHLFTDHPPTGFWIMALFYKTFGINEFWTRFPSALSGIISIILVCFLGRKLFNPLVGLISGIALSSAIWFIYRSRLGDLDVLLTMFFLLTIFLAIKSTENKKYLPIFLVSLILLFLTKTMVPLVIIPTLILIFYKNKLYKWSELFLPIAIFLIVMGSWFALRLIKDHHFIQHFIGIGLPGLTLKSNFLDNLSLAKEYLHSGLGKWFWGGLITIMLSVFLKQKRFFIFIIFFASFIAPITFSPKIQIWHLIPLYPILILSFFGFTFAILEKYLSKWKYQIYIFVLVFSTIIYLNQIKIIWYQVIDIPAFISDEAILSREAAKYPQSLIVDGDYVPAALFYSEKGIVSKASNREDDFIALLKSKNDFLMITNQWRLDNPSISVKDYKILKKDRDKVLILHKAVGL